MTTIELGQLTTTYHVRGDGPNIVWVSGGGGSGADWHEHFVPAFADRYRNITFDNRGILGTKCQQEEPWSIADMSADVAQLIEHVCDSPAVIIGHSLGAFMAVQLALDRPDLVELAVPMGGGARGDAGWAGDYMRAEIALRRRGGVLDPDFAAIHYAALMYPANALQDPVIWPKIKAFLSSREFQENNEATVVSQWQPCVDFNVTDRLSSLKVPMDVVAFSGDLSSLPAYSAELVRLAPGARYHEIAGLGHSSLFGHKPGDVSEVLDMILNNHFTGDAHVVQPHRHALGL